MQIAEQIETEQRRLAWRCRRGMLELDIVLKKFVATAFEQLILEELHTFNVMLDMPDNEFWALISAQEVSKDEAIRAIVKKIKTA